MATTREQWLMIGMISSALGALTIFGPWLTIDYYDHYGAIYESYNGFTLFDSGYHFGLAMFVPILISIIFVLTFIRFKVYGNQKCTKYIVGAFIAIFLLSWYFNVSADWTYDNYPQYTGVYGTGLAETGAVGIAFINIIFASLADSRYYDNSKSTEPNRFDTKGPMLQDTINFCPNCGADLTSQNGERPIYCPKCGSYLGDK